MTRQADWLRLVMCCDENVFFFLLYERVSEEGGKMCQLNRLYILSCWFCVTQIQWNGWIKVSWKKVWLFSTRLNVNFSLTAPSSNRKRRRTFLSKEWKSHLKPSTLGKERKNWSGEFGLKNFEFFSSQYLIPLEASTISAWKIIKNLKCQKQIHSMAKVDIIMRVNNFHAKIHGCHGLEWILTCINFVFCLKKLIQPRTRMSIFSYFTWIKKNTLTTSNQGSEK